MAPMATEGVQQPLDPSDKVHNLVSLPEVGFVRLPQILAVFPVGRSTWWAGVKAGRFPQPVKLGPRVTAWRVEEVRALLSSMSAGQ